MNKYYINSDIKESPTEAELINEKTFEWCGTKYNFEYKFINDYILVLRVDNQNYIIKAETDLETELSNTEFDIDIKSDVKRLICKSELDILMEKFSKSRGGGKIKNDVVSPMPGAIVKINVKEGQEVKKGAVLLVLEAMKMENELKALNDCKVQKILVEEKKSVDKGQLLMKLEPLISE